MAKFQTKYILEKAGFWSLCLTLFILSFPRSWSLYPLTLFLITGLGLWTIDFKNIFGRLIKVWYLVLPPIVYFLVHLGSVIIQGSGISILEERLMFLLVPLFGFPVFTGKYTETNISMLFSAFIFGIVIISSFLLVRVIFLIYSDYHGEMPLLTWLTQNEISYFSIGFSVLEHPTYFALKINWGIILLLFSRQITSIKSKRTFLIILLLSIILFLLASKAGLFFWFLIILVYLISNINSKRKDSVIYLGLIPIFVLVVVISVMGINRINAFVSTLRSELSDTHIDWKNIDQRTREWFTSVQLIKEKPFTGFGLGKINDKMVDEYLKNGFKDEADLRMNAHNQFLEAQMTFGIAGTISLLWMLLTPVFLRKRPEFGNLAIAFIAIISFFLLFESMFNRQWGIMFFLLFYFLLIPFDKNVSDYEQLVR